MLPESIGGSVVRSSQRGAILPLIVVALPAMLLMLALALDIGNMMSIKEQMQTAADAGALAGAMEIGRESGLAVTQARLATASNGFTHGQGTVSVTVNPSSLGTCDSNRRGASYTEVIISQSYNFYFLRRLTTVSACAVSATPSKRICLFATGGSGTTLSTSGNSTVQVNGCGLQVNSNGNPAATTGGNSGISSSSTTIVGTVSGSGFNPPAITGVQPLADPFVTLAAPVPPYPLSCTSSAVDFSTITLNPGVYCGGITAKGGTVTFNPGTYILLGGGLKTESNGNLRQNGGVTFYSTCARLAGNTGGTFQYSGADGVNRLCPNVATSLPTGCTGTLCQIPGPFNISSNGTVSLGAPTSGTYKGILFFGDRNVVSLANRITGTGSGSVYNDSVFYFPSQPVALGGTATLNGAVVSSSMTLQGGSGFTVNYSVAVSGSAELQGSRAYLQ